MDGLHHLFVLVGACDGEHGRMRLADRFFFDAVAAGYDDADVVIVNTCGFLDSAKAESLSAIGEAMEENGRVIVTGC
jgi:tRNA A37 methylthiotransferase MiaB